MKRMMMNKTHNYVGNEEGAPSILVSCVGEPPDIPKTHLNQVMKAKYVEFRYLALNTRLI